MTAGDLIVGGLIVLMVVGAMAVLWYNRKKGRNSCGCNCSGCSKAGCCGQSMVAIDDGSDSCEKD